MKATITFAILLFAGGISALAQFTNTSSVLDGAGTISSGGGYTNISAAGQPGGISVTMAGTLPLDSDTIVNQAGFLNTFFMRPGQRSVHGLPVEIDPDNDGDGLGDVVEVTGSAFNPATPTDPNNPDSDVDGLPDGSESIAGTDPSDGNSALRITSINVSNGQCYVSWFSRGNNERTYCIRIAGDPGQPFSTVIFSNSVAGGAAPWYDVTNTIVDASATNKLFYRVDVAF